MPKRWSAAGVLLAQALLVAAIYWPTRRLAFASDAWHYLERLRQGALSATATPIGYHWQPVAVAWIAAIRGALGENAAAFQVVNLVQLTVFGHLTFQLGKRLLADTHAAFLGSVLVVGSAAFYQATYWPLAGNMHLLGALLYVLSTVLAYDVATGRLGRGGPWLLGLTVLGAVFSHPAMVTSLVVCALILLVFGREHPWRERLTSLLPLAVPGLLFVVARIAFRSYFVAAPKPGFELTRIVWLVGSGLLPVFSLRGSVESLEWVLTLGGHTDSVARIWMGAGAWLAAATMAAGLCLWRARTNGVRLLVAFLAIHLAALTVASALSPRQIMVASVPAALLTACALRALAARLAVRAGGGAAAPARALPAVVVALLIAAAQPDHRTARDLHVRVAEASRALEVRIRAVSPGRGPVRLTLINMPATLGAKGISAFAFQNGLGELAHLTNAAVGKVDLWRIPIRGAPAHIVVEIPWLTQDGLREQLAEPDRVVLFYEDDPVDVQRLTAADADRLTARWTAPAPDQAP